MRVAFAVVGGSAWTGGVNYLRNLLSAIAELPDKPVEAVLFFAEGTDESVLSQLTPYLAEPPILVEGWGSGKWRRGLRLFCSVFLQKDFVSERAFKDARIDVVFQHAAWYGVFFSFPTVAWIADFQHKHLPRMFSFVNRLKRDIGYQALTWSATRVMVSSYDAKEDCERFFPRFKGRVSVLQFCVTRDPRDLVALSGNLRVKYNLPENYFFLPNQLWKHKNHLAVLEALQILERRGCDVSVVASGNPKDSRNPEYPLAVLEKAKGIRGFIFLGLVPYEEIVPLMSGSLGVVNPSLFEGWSTTVEEAKANRFCLLLSDIKVHREQAQADATFFDPRSAHAIADSLQFAWEQKGGPASSKKLSSDSGRRNDFAVGFHRILASAVHPGSSGARR